MCSSCVSPCAWNNDLFLGYEIFGTLKKNLVRFTGLSKPFQFRSIDVERSKPSYLWVPLLVGAACALVHAHIYHSNYKVDPVDLPYYFRTEIRDSTSTIHWSITKLMSGKSDNKKTMLSNLADILEFPHVLEHGHSSRTFRCSSSLLSWSFNWDSSLAWALCRISRSKPRIVHF